MALSNNKRIALNTGIIYVKLLLSIIVGLYTSRLILLSLGAEDYGLYTVVGGVVSMMNFLGITMMSVTYRYIVVEFGKGELGNPQKVFNTSLVIHIVLAVLLILVGETFGVYYITNVAHIDSSKIADALFVLHLSLTSTCFVILSVPYNGLIVAREKFVFTAFVEIGRTVLKFIMVIGLSYYCGNRIRMFSVIMTVFSIILPISMYIYCFIKDRTIIKWKFNKNKSDYKGILGYAVWIMIGALASIGQNQGSNIIINLFFSTVVNAAFGIGFQINNYVMMFVQGLNQAAVPQIMKSQSSNDTARSAILVNGIGRIAFFIMLLPAIPLLLNMDFVLKVWLKKVPDYTSIFASLLLIGGLIRCLGAGFDAAIQATGKIKPFQIFYSVAYLMVLPVAYMLFQLGLPPYTIIMCTIMAASSILIFQVIYLSKITNFEISQYLNNTVKKCVLVFVCLTPLFALKTVLEETYIWFFFSCFISIIWMLTIIYTLGCTHSERQKVLSLILRNRSH